MRLLIADDTPTLTSAVWDALIARDPRGHLVQTWAWAYQTAGEGLLQEDPTRAAEALEEARRMLRGDPARRAGLEGPS